MLQEVPQVLQQLLRSRHACTACNDAGAALLTRLVLFIQACRSPVVINTVKK
jgi:hypothetical protein